MKHKIEVDFPAGWGPASLAPKAKWERSELFASDGIMQFTVPVRKTWQFPSDKLPGAACILRNRDGDYFSCGSVVRVHSGDSCFELRGSDALYLSSLTVKHLGITLPESTGDWKTDIWYNPEHPDNRGVKR